jgi:hypothetical protein
VVTSFKRYGDFKRLHKLIELTNLTREDGRSQVLPALPAKLDASGIKKQDATMT